MEITEDAVKLLARQEDAARYGARPLRRRIASLVEDPAADLILEGRLKKNDTLLIYAEQNQISVKAK